jgi:predicted transposase YdaD
VKTEAQFEQLLDLAEAILIYKLPQLSIEKIRQMLDLRNATLRHTRFYQEVLQEGRQEGEAELVLRLLARKCGPLSDLQQEQVRALERSQVEALGEAMLDFDGMADLQAWLQQHA